MKVFDCTTFYNENMMLEVRFNILDSYVDAQLSTFPNKKIESYDDIDSFNVEEE